MGTSDILSIVAIGISFISLFFSILISNRELQLQRITNNINLYNEKKEILYYFSNLQKPQDKLSLYIGKNFILKEIKMLFSHKLYGKILDYINNTDTTDKYNDDCYKELLKEMENEIEKSIK